MNNKISGSYIIQSNQRLEEYTFTGNDRAAIIPLTNVGKVPFICLSNGRNLNPEITFLTKNKIHVKGIRVVTPGGAGLRSCAMAAYLHIAMYVNDTLVDNFPVISVVNFNEWQKIDDLWEPYKLTKDENFYLGISGGFFNVDDYNIQEKYIGEKVGFKIELSIDTAGLKIENDII